MDHRFRSYRSHLYLTEWFDEYEKIQPVSGNLPNGNATVAEFSDSVKLSESMILKDFLYIPEFSFNLISISSLTIKMKCFFVFTDSSCCVQDSSTTMIGSAKLMMGLYYLKSQHYHSSSLNKVCNSVVVPHYALWHFRLGHLSNFALEKMCAKFLYVLIKLQLVRFIILLNKRNSLIK